MLRHFDDDWLRLIIVIIISSSSSKKIYFLLFSVIYVLITVLYWVFPFEFSLGFFIKRFRSFSHLFVLVVVEDTDDVAASSLLLSNPHSHFRISFQQGRKTTTATTATTDEQLTKPSLEKESNRRTFCIYMITVITIDVVVITAVFPLAGLISFY